MFVKYLVFINKYFNFRNRDSIFYKFYKIIKTTIQTKFLLLKYYINLQLYLNSNVFD